MKLATVVINNFRCCKQTAFRLGAMHALVGANNAGKSTILHGLDFLFNPTTSKISQESFWQCDTSLEIRVEAVFVELDEHELEAFKPYLRPDNSFHLARTARCETDESGDLKFTTSQQYSKPLPKYPWLRESEIKAAAIKEWENQPDALIANGHSFFEFLGGKTKVGEWKEAAISFVEKLGPDDFEDAWIDNPQGYSGVLKGNLPHFEMIPAVRQAMDESKVSKTNPFGRLIYRIVHTLEDSFKTDIGSKLKETTNRLNRGTTRLQGVIDVEKAMNDYLTEMMPADLEIEFQCPTIESLLTTPKLHIDDGFRGSIDGKGHGLQRAVIFAILRSYAKLVTTQKENGKKTLILGIEEPELYMHPTAQRMIRRVLRKIADGGDQILFTTHSPLLVDVAYFDEIIRVEPGEKNTENGASIHQLSMDAMIEDILARWPTAKNVTPESMRERYGHAYTPTRNEGFFARRVLLVEGQTESYSLPIYSEALGTCFDANGIACIDCGGKDQIDRLFRVFNELGIPCYVLFDYDQGNADAVKSSKYLLTFLSHVEGEEVNAPIVSDRFACFLRTWEKDIDEQILNRDQLAADATKMLGRCGKPLKARFMASRLTNQDKALVPEILQQILARAVNVTRNGTCLQKNVTTENPAAVTAVTQNA